MKIEVLAMFSNIYIFHTYLHHIVESSDRVMVLYLEDKHELRSVSCSIHCSDGRRYIIRLGGGGGGGSSKSEDN